MEFDGRFEFFNNHEIPFLVNNTLAMTEDGGAKAPSWMMLETKAVMVMDSATMTRPIRE